MLKTKKILSLFLCLSMVMLFFIPAMAEDHTHEWRWVVDVPATCGADGIQHEICLGCDETRYENTVLPATGNHTLIWVLDVEPTCVAGEEHQYCTVCGQTLNWNTPVQAVNEHTYEWVTDTAPTCTLTGLKHKKCTVCGYDDPLTSDTVIAATGIHSWGEGEASESAPCLLTYTCSVCGGEKTEAIAATNSAAHNWEWVVDVDASCAGTGLQHQKCSGCGQINPYTTDSVIAATGAHVDDNSDGQCDKCGVSMPSGTNSGTTLWKIIQSVMNFFNSLFSRISALFSK